ncbi:hypothetical protein O181_073136 [Austropuccinia psidii MF-1]|uniref:Uncharacterized protein n=1 Tax=Austropuccinia psidii MF-1 TaxID=1389203 RepID=A0A9Q3FAI7_9BASI|nr:hypothetical protein [Austropuccinia psidii MF-1]
MTRHIWKPISKKGTRCWCLHSTSIFSRDQKNERFICGALHYHSVDRIECSVGYTHSGILQETPSIPSESGQTILPDRRGRFLPRKKNTTPPDIVEVEDSPGPVKKIIKARNIRLNDKYQRQYLVRLKSRTENKDKWLAEDSIPDGKLHLARFGASGRTEKSHKW